MKKILFLVTQSEMGGAQRYIFEVAKVLGEKHEILVAAGEPAFAEATAGKGPARIGYARRHDCRQAVGPAKGVAGGDCEFFQKLKTIGVGSRRLKQLKRTPWPWQITSAIWEIRNLLKKEKPDVLFLCSTTAGLLGSLASLNDRGRTSIIYRIGGWAFRDPRAFWINWLVLLAEKLTAPLKDLVIVNSEIDRKLALKYRIVPERKLVKIYNGIDVGSLQFFSRAEARKHLNLFSSDNEKIIGTVANFYKTKGLEYLIQAASRLIEVRPQSIFIIIGEGRLRPKLERLIKKYGLENKVLLTGRIPDAYKYLKAFDVFVLPSLKEGFPWIILEAIAAQVPIVATKVGALPEILNEESLVAPGDTQVLAKKISRALERPTKSQLKQEFSSQRMIAETEMILQQLTAGKN